MKIQHLFVLPFILAIGCVSVKKNAPFTIEGKITDSYGNPAVLNAADSVSICVKANYVSDTGNAGSQTECVDVVTDQSGHYTSRAILKISETQAQKTVDIKNAKIYGKKYSASQSGYYYFTVNVVSSEVNTNGGRFIANMSVFNLD